MKLNIGCRTTFNLTKGWKNLDICKPCDIQQDLNKIPYKIKENSVEQIEATYILEHLEKWEDCLKELIRISKNKAIIKIKVPIGSNSLMHPNHKRVFGINTFEALCETDGRYGTNKFKIIYKKVNPTTLGKLIPNIYITKKIKLREYISLFLGEIIKDMEIWLEVRKE